jgi:hypothetical protein
VCGVRARRGAGLLGRVAERVCAYAVAAGRLKPLRLRGVAAEPLRAVPVGGIELVVGLVPRAPRAAAATLRRYDEVMRRLMDVYASVLPARFGTCAASVEQLAESVRDRRVAFRRNLRLVRNRVQMTVRLFRSEFGVGPGSDRGRTRVRPRSEYEYEATQGTQYLQQRAEELRIPEADLLRRAVARRVRAERMERYAEGRLAGSVYHLVARGAVPAYRRAIERAALDAGLTTIVSGPWPPYAFTE